MDVMQAVMVGGSWRKSFADEPQEAGKKDVPTYTEYISIFEEYRGVEYLPCFGPSLVLHHSSNCRLANR